MGYLQERPEKGSTDGQILFDIYHDFQLERFGVPRTGGYRQHIKLVTYPCSKCKEDLLAREIIYRIIRADCDACDDWNLCYNCFDKMGPDTKKAIENNPSIIPWEEW